MSIATPAAPGTTSRPTRPTAPPVRLTGRGRVVIVVVALLSALGALIWHGGPAASSGVAHHEHAATVIVRPGQTVWDIARRAEPGVDPRVVVAQIVQMNGLRDPGDVQPGEPLYVPSR